MGKHSIEIVITKANLVHKNKYDYSLVEYVNTDIKVKIICPIHGNFEQTPHDHLGGHGCSKCGDKSSKDRTKSNINKLIKTAKEIHNDKYDYSLVEYVNTDTKIKIICPIHGVFEQTPHHHIKGSGCSECKGVKKSTTSEFIEKVKIIHNNRYDYSLVKYVNNHTKIKILCNKHGVFEQTPNDHLSGSNCRKCLTCDINDFIKISDKLHGNKYDYSLVNYRIENDKVKIICPIHGVFEQKIKGHLQGNGCRTCSDSKGEREIRNYLIENKIVFVGQYRFSNCRDKYPLPFDFYLPELNLCIEYDGEQHFRPIRYWGGESAFIKIKKRDKIKTDYCETNNIDLFRISYDDEVISSLRKKISVINH